jgi:diguanylate cyclase (GGDEF)-like protein
METLRSQLVPELLRGRHSAGDAVRLFSRLVEGAVGGGSNGVQERLVQEAREFFGASRAALVSISGDERLKLVASDPQGEGVPDALSLADAPAISALLERGSSAVEAGEGATVELAKVLGASERPGSALLVPLRLLEGADRVLVLIDDSEDCFTEEDLELAGAFAQGAAACLAQVWAVDREVERSERLAALFRAAKTLGGTLDLDHVLDRVCEEAAGILGAESAVVFLTDRRGGLRAEVAYGQPDQVIGLRLAPGEGFPGKVADAGRPMLTNDYESLAGSASAPLFSKVRSCVAVPMGWHGELRGVLAVGYTRRHQVTRDELRLLCEFGEIAATASGNASEHAGVALAARTDALTGCLNHAALQDTLRRELERCGRTGCALSLALVDLDEFKQVNEEHGHLMGDEVLRRVGKALRTGVRAYDSVARYGGDEFALVAVEADEQQAVAVANRAIAEIDLALSEPGMPVGVGRATAGVARWDGSESATALIERADLALLYGKQRGHRGVAIAAGEVPEDFRLETAPRGRGLPLPRPRRPARQPAVSESR